MKLHTLILLLVACLMAGIFLASLVYYAYARQNLLEYQEMAADFRVEHGVAGLNADTDALHFGAMVPGGYSQRHMTVTPAHDGRLVIRFSGEAAPYLSAVPATLPVSEGTPVNVTFTAAPPEGMAEGDYYGTAKFYFYRR